MSRSKSGHAKPSLSDDRKGLRFIHGLIAFAIMVVALPLAVIGGMALVGIVTTNVWVQLVVAALILLIAPLILADRLLPNDPSKRRPGLVRDVLAGSWAIATLAVIGLSGSITAAPLHAEAAQLEAQGFTEAAWLSRWMAGPVEPEPAVEPEPEPAPDAEPTPAPGATELAHAEPSDPSEAATAKPEPASEPESEPKPKPSEVNAKPEALREYSPAELFSTYAPSVVSIATNHGGFRSGGTGFFIDDQGVLATNHHVIAGARELRVKLFDGTELTRVELLTVNEKVDLALLRVDLADLPKPPIAAVLGDSAAVEVGEAVSVIGNPLGLDHTLTNGIVSARRIYEGERYIQMSAPISPGNSGGPVFDRYGRVIGVSVAQMTGGQNLNLAVPVAELQALVAADYPNRRSFGASSW